MNDKNAALPELLLPGAERRLRAVIRSIVRAYPDKVGRTDDDRVASAVDILFGRKRRRGAPGRNRDEMLAMMAMMYAIAKDYQNKEPSFESLAKSVIDMPGGAGKDPEGSIARDLARKFRKHAPELLRQHAYDGADNSDKFFMDVGQAATSIAALGIAVDRDGLPPDSDKGDNPGFFSDDRADFM
ncbi:hypothetical protein ABMA32_00045 [Mesorhizobium sp. VNQ89]|uniref:hypothetical protein n=1 Tax=Mesorhizobium quangtriensis TaxID=3157709 RepID=UPI0032B78C3D